MKRRLFMAAALAALSAAAFAQGKKQDKPAIHASPLAAVQAVYDPKVTEAQRPYSPRLRKAYAAAIRKSRQLGEPVSGLDFDPTINAQDNDDDFRASLKYSVEPRPERNALVIVKLRVFKDAKETVLHYEVTPQGEGFVIDDIISPDPKEGWRLSKLLAAGAEGK